ncbi:MAG: coenzyme F420-0:L-glutamate ligase [Oscillospiraceae bacterium]
MTEATPNDLKCNPDKNLTIEYNGGKYQRIPVKTHIITDIDNINDVIVKYAKPFLEDGDIIFISEKIVACTQKRAIKLTDIKPRKLAVFLSKHVVKTNYGIGLAMPETMEMALRECGTLRILFAAAISVITKKIFHKSGWFYRVAGEGARAIDGPCEGTIPPYNEYVVLGPLKPQKVAAGISAAVGGNAVCIVDANDIACLALGCSHPKQFPDVFFEQVLRDNPLGQDNEQTPVGIIRKI